MVYQMKIITTTSRHVKLDEGSDDPVGTYAACGLRSLQGGRLSLDRMVKLITYQRLLRAAVAATRSKYRASRACPSPSIEVHD